MMTKSEAIILTAILVLFSWAMLHVVKDATAQDTAPLEVEVKDHVDQIIIDRALYDQIARIEGKIDWLMQQHDQQRVEDAVNINTATYEELLTVAGIGPIKAGSIIAERGQAGKFASWQDMINRVSGVGPATVADMQAVGATLE